MKRTYLIVFCLVKATPNKCFTDLGATAKSPMFDGHLEIPAPHAGLGACRDASPALCPAIADQRSALVELGASRARFPERVLNCLSSHWTFHPPSTNTGNHHLPHTPPRLLSGLHGTHRRQPWLSESAPAAPSPTQQLHQHGQNGVLCSTTE